MIRGYINLSIAENNRMFSMLQKKICEIHKSTTIPVQVSMYDDISGNYHFKKSFSKMMENTFFKKKIDPNHLILTNGCGPLVDSLMHVLCDEGNYSFMK